MKLESVNKGIYKLVRIETPLKVVSELSELQSLIEGYVARDEIYVAVNFTHASYLYSGAISVLINCYKLIRNKQGILCIVEPNASLVDLLRQMNIDTIIPIYQSENDLPSKPPLN